MFIWSSVHSSCSAVWSGRENSDVAVYSFLFGSLLTAQNILSKGTHGITTSTVKIINVFNFASVQHQSGFLITQSRFEGKAEGFGGVVAAATNRIVFRFQNDAEDQI